MYNWKLELFRQVHYKIDCDWVADGSSSKTIDSKVFSFEVGSSLRSRSF
jgi:hypothetical protein